MEETSGKPKNPQEKRLDLQGIRGIAIISVILFHFFPNFFPNGYVGVDQFFVLSGFLMCMLLKKSSSNCSSYNFEWITNFYIRRLKRIVPLYFLLIFLSLLAIFTIFPYTSIESNINSARNALIFKSNRMETENEDYFKMLSIAIDVFTHTWSLSVEVQFYLLVPFIYFIGAKLDQYSKWLELPYHLVIGLLSFTYSTYYCTEKYAFHSVLARVWQFSVGMIAYLIVSIKTSNLEEKYQLLPENDEEFQLKSSNWTINYKNILTIIIIILSIYSKEIQFVRLFQTILTGILMCFSDEMIIKSNNFMIIESKCLIYFGNISYSLYLIHWPIYAFWKLNLSNRTDSNFILFIALISSILLAILSYELFEKWYLKQTNQLILILSLTLFTLNMGLLYQRDINNFTFPSESTHHLDGLKTGEKMSYYKAEQLNRQWSIYDLTNLRAPSCEYLWGKIGLGPCRHKGLDTKSGKFKFMLIGNSWAANHARLFYEECGPKAKSIFQLSNAGCEPLYTFVEKTNCTSSLEYLKTAVANEKPDYLFIFSRFIDIGNPMPPNVTSLDKDPIYQKMKNQLEIYEKAVKNKVFLMNQIARFDSKKGYLLARAVHEKWDLVEFDKSLVARDPSMARLRYEKLASECSKCALFDYKPYFFNETTQTWRFYDEQRSGLTYLTGGIHLSFHGLELIRPVIKSVCNSL